MLRGVEYKVVKMPVAEKKIIKREPIDVNQVSEKVNKKSVSKEKREMISEGGRVKV